MQTLSGPPVLSERPPEPMRKVHVVEITLDNFKSFAKKTTIPLLSGFTTISGPNGSGKSNFVDAFLFVLGLSSSKTMRAERLTDLINATSGRTDARVSLKLWLEDDQSTVEVSRIVKAAEKDSASPYHSTYYLDGHPVPLNVLHQRLAPLGISPKGHNVVMQGDVTRILTMTPSDRRRVIDDLAGVAEFDEKIEAARREIQGAERHIETTRVLKVELDTRLMTLTSEKDRAQEYLGLRDQKDHLERTLLSRRLLETRREVAGLRTRLANGTKRRDELVGQVARLEKQLVEKKEHFVHLDREILQMTEADRKGGFGRLEELRTEIAKASSFIDYLQATVNDALARAAEIAKQAGGAKERRAALKADLETLYRERHAAEVALAKERAAAEKLEGKLTRAGSDQAQKFADLPSLRRSLEEAREVLAGLKSQEQSALLRLELATREEERLGKDRATLEERQSAISSGSSESSRRQRDVSAKVEECYRAVLDARGAHRAAQDKLARLEEQYRSAYRDLARLEASAQAAGGASTGALSLLLASGIKGILGRVVDLVEWPEKYRVALEVAGGRRWDNVVVTDEHAAVAAIEFLRSKGAGRLTFLPLTKIRQEPPSEAVSGKGVIGFAFDLVKHKPEHQHVLALVLGDTLVVDTIKTGLPFLGRHRAVTLEGDLLEKTGAMTGGSAPAPRKAAPEVELTVKRRSLEALEAEARATRAQLPALEKRAHDLAEEHTRAREEEASLKVAMEGVSKEGEDLMSRLSAARSAHQKAAAEKATIERERAAFASQLEKTAKLVADRETTLLAAEKSLASAALKELSEETRLAQARLSERDQALRKVVEKVRERELEEEFTSKSLELSRKETAETEAKAADLTRQVKAKTKELEKLRAEEAGLRESLAKVAKDLATKREERDALAAALETQGKEREDAREELAKLAAELAGGEGRLTELDQTLKGLEEQAAAIKLDPAQYPSKGPMKDLEQGIAGLAAQLEAFGPVNLLAIDQHRELTQRIGELSGRIETLEKERSELLERMGRFEDQRRHTFMQTFEGVRAHYSRVYADLSGGEGDLVLENPDNPFAGGLIIKARPRGKKMERIDALSGGEKSLAALSFVFSYQSFCPAPFYIFDEVDMFLDTANTEALAHMLGRQAETTQFLVVSLKSAMLDQSERTIGVFARQGGVSQVAGLSMSAAGEREHATAAAAAAASTATPSVARRAQRGAR